ncbi:hypothetical protein MY4824_000217 [Beauveria thailandica]
MQDESNPALLASDSYPVILGVTNYVVALPVRLITATHAIQFLDKGTANYE